MRISFSFSRPTTAEIVALILAVITLLVVLVKPLG